MKSFDEAFENQERPPEDEAPRSLRRGLPPSEPYPVEYLGAILEDACADLHTIIKSPQAICAQSLLAVASLATQGHADVAIDGRVHPLSENFLTIAESGERKTTTDDAALKAHDGVVLERCDQYEAEGITHANDIELFAEARKKIMRSKKSEDMKRMELKELGKEPEAPIEPLDIVEEPTYEGIVKALHKGWPSMGIFSSEGGRFLGGHAMNDDNQVKTVAGLSSLWDGKPITRSRAGDGTIILRGRRVAVHLMVQPQISAILFSNQLLSSQGILSRFLVAYPTSTIGTREYNDKNVHARLGMVNYSSRMGELFRHPLPMRDGKKNELSPRSLGLTPGAKKLHQEFHNHIEKLCREDGELSSIKGLAAKAAEHSLRLAGILTLVDDIEAREIAELHLSRGNHLMDFYLHEALRLFDSAVDNPKLITAERLLRWALAEDQHVHLSAIYQRGPRRIRDKATAKEAVAVLVDHGHLIPIKGGAVVDERMRKEAWRVYGKRYTTNGA